MDRPFLFYNFYYQFSSLFLFSPTSPSHCDLISSFSIGLPRVMLEDGICAKWTVRKVVSHQGQVPSLPITHPL